MQTPHFVFFPDHFDGNSPEYKLLCLFYIGLSLLLLFCLFFKLCLGVYIGQKLGDPWSRMWLVFYPSDSRHCYPNSTFHDSIETGEDKFG